MNDGYLSYNFFYLHRYYYAFLQNVAHHCFYCHQRHFLLSSWQFSCHWIALHCFLYLNYLPLFDRFFQLWKRLNRLYYHLLQILMYVFYFYFLYVLVLLTRFQLSIFLIVESFERRISHCLSYYYLFRDPDYFNIKLLRKNTFHIR